MTLVMVGLATRSSSASSPRVSGPALPTVASTEAWVGERSLSLVWRSCRARRVTARRRRPASSAVSSAVGGGGTGTSFHPTN